MNGRAEASRRIQVLPCVEVSGARPIPVPVVRDEGERVEEGSLDFACQVGEEELEAIRASARKSGWDEGFKEGYQKGRELAIDEMRGLLGTLETIRKSLEEGRSQMLSELEKEISALTFEIAEKLAMQEITASPDAVARLVKRVIERSGERKSLKVRLSPEDYRKLREANKELFASVAGMGEIDFMEDERLQEGDCVVETPVGIVDARMKRRLKRVRDSVMGESGANGR